jgi:archaemetzincin
MRIKIFWDPQAPVGLQRPAVKGLSSVLGMPVEMAEHRFLLNGFDPSRNQYDAQKILSRIQLFKRQHGISEPVLLVVSQDLCLPRQDFVFGLARESVGAAVVSMARLHNRFYGREDDDGDLVGRLIREGAHEVGHLFGLEHCASKECVMYPPATLGELDRKKVAFCGPCRARLSSAEGIDRL